MRLDLNRNIEPRDAIAAGGGAVLNYSSTLGSVSGGSSSLLGGWCTRLGIWRRLWLHIDGRRFRGCFGDFGHGLGLGLGLWEGWLQGRANSHERLRLDNRKATARRVVRQDRTGPLLQPAQPPQLGALLARRLATRRARLVRSVGRGVESGVRGVVGRRRCFRVSLPFWRKLLLYIRLRFLVLCQNQIVHFRACAHAFAAAAASSATPHRR